MTNEEAIKILKNAIKKPNTEDGYLGQALTMATKALEQQPIEPVLDKIRAEIEELDGRYVIGDYGIYGENIPKYIRLYDALDIIDKYKAERGDKE